MKGTKLLSLVVPAYKQEKTIVKDLSNIQGVLKTLPYNYEIILVVDGDLDTTHQKVKSLKNSKISIELIEENKGKGNAVRHGVGVAKGDIIGFIDAGMDIDPQSIPMLLNHMEWYDADVIVGSKLHPVSQVNYPFYRKILSRGYRTLTQLLFGFSVRDTQVGIKFFKKKVAKDVFSRSLIKTFAFDVEVLALAYALGYTRIYEAPIRLSFRNTTSITSKTMMFTISRMLIDTFAIYYRLKVKQYYRKSNRSNWLENIKKR